MISLYVNYCFYFFFFLNIFLCVISFITDFDSSLFESPSFYGLYLWRADFQNLLHSLLHVTHLQLRSQQRSQFSTQNLLQMDNVDTTWNLEQKIPKKLKFYNCKNCFLTLS